MKGQFDLMTNLVMWNNSLQGKWNENFKKQEKLLNMYVFHSIFISIISQSNLIVLGRGTRMK